MPQRGQRLDLSFLNELVQPICGQPLTGMWRAVGQLFEFGEQKPATNIRGEAITGGDFQLKFISADWRIVQRGRIILGSSDHCGETWFYDYEEQLCRPYDEDARRLAREFFDEVASGKFIAESVVVGDLADLKIVLSDALEIQSFGSSGEDHDLWWCHNLRMDVSCLVGPSGHNVGRSGELYRGRRR